MARRTHWVDNELRQIRAQLDRIALRGRERLRYRPPKVDVGALRRKIGMSQEEFAARFGFSVTTLRHWERGERQPTGPALVLLNLISADHLAILGALQRMQM